MAKLLEYNATLEARVDIAPGLAHFFVRPDEPPAEFPWFVAGQYCVIGLNNEAQPELGSVRRSMSIASSPHHRGAAEFYIRRVSTPESANPLTPQCFGLQAGARLYMRPVAAGKFTLPDTVGAGDPRVCIMVAAGTGLAPFVSMVREAIDAHPSRTPDLSRYAILHGVSRDNELGYRQELEGYVATLGLRYVPTVSRPAESPTWSGQTGRVENLFVAENLDRLATQVGVPAINPTTCTVLICGLQGTIGNTLTSLLHRGFVPDHRRIRTALGVPDEAPHTLFFEQYDTEPVVDIKTPASLAALHAAMQAGFSYLAALGAPGTSPA
ncbi:MAG: hypothetical protein IPL79_17135 [Myxococcales bacterium]|nr:hypothetical protein [Myxococcales bacterium]